MSPEAQRIVIAEACGWKSIQASDYKPFGKSYLVGVSTDGSSNLKKVPDYLNDLNAMHEATQSLTKDQLRWYRNLLIEMTGTFEAIDATAAQRAEAFLRTIGKWEEEAKP